MTYTLPLQLVQVLNRPSQFTCLAKSLGISTYFFSGGLFLKVSLQITVTSTPESIANLALLKILRLAFECRVSQLF